jgi:hypothetical protein
VCRADGWVRRAGCARPADLVGLWTVLAGNPLGALGVCKPCGLLPAPSSGADRHRCCALARSRRIRLRRALARARGGATWGGGERGRGLGEGAASGPGPRTGKASGFPGRPGAPLRHTPCQGAPEGRRCGGLRGDGARGRWARLRAVGSRSHCDASPFVLEPFPAARFPGLAAPARPLETSAYAPYTTPFIASSPGDIEKRPAVRGWQEPCKRRTHVRIDLGTGTFASTVSRWRTPQPATRRPASVTTASSSPCPRRCTPPRRQAMAEVLALGHKLAGWRG